MAGRFIAGANAADAVPALSELAAQGAGYTVDLLGEETLSDFEADAYAQRYAELIETLSEHKAALLPAGGDALWAELS